MEKSLYNNESKELNAQEKDKGKRKRYSVDSVAKLESVKGNVFYLLAFTKLKKQKIKL